MGDWFAPKNSIKTRYDLNVLESYQAVDANGATTTYTYGNCKSAFVSSVSLPLGLSTSQTWNCAGGVQTSVTAHPSGGRKPLLVYRDYRRPTSALDLTSE
ncbi:MAG: hypothetical protein WB992_03250 [Bryobacteraceae bacterium]